MRLQIKLALLYPSESKYQHFLDGLLEIYRDGKRSAADGRLGDAGRKHRVTELEGRLCALLLPHPRETTSEMPPHEHDFTNLVNELGRLVMAEELFTFVLEPAVEATNNLSERNLRSSAQDRKAGRTNKTAKGAHRRSVIVSVLQSLRTNLANFSLTSVLAETGRWMKEGLSLFTSSGRRFRPRTLLKSSARTATNSPSGRSKLAPPRRRVYTRRAAFVHCHNGRVLVRRCW